MTRAAALLLAALACRAAAAPPAPDALDAKAAEWAAKGFPLKERIAGPVDGMTVAAAVYGAADGSGDRFETYVLLNGKAYLGYSHPGATERLEIDEDPAGRGFHDLLKDGSRVIAYRATIRALNASTLVVLSYKNFKFRVVGRFPEGRFVTGNGRLLIMARDLPLGRFLSVGCEDFGMISQTAFRTRLYAPAKGRFVEVTGQHPEVFASEIQRKTAALLRLKGDLQKNAAEYLGLSLSLYYDYAARGEARAGWEKQMDFFKIPGYAPASVKACFESMRKDLRGRLGIPAAWP